MLYPVFFACFTFIGILLAMECGLRMGRAHESDDDKAKTTAFNGVLFALLGLLLAFSFNGAYQRFDQRQALAVEEAIAINHFHNLLALAPEASQKELKDHLKAYTSSRIAIYKKLPDIDSAMQEFHHSKELKKVLKNTLYSAIPSVEKSPIASQLITSLAVMFHIEEKRYAVKTLHPPIVVFYLLCGLAITASFLTGYEKSLSKTKPLLHGVLFAMVLSSTIYITIDMETPRFGFIIADQQDYLLTESLATMLEE